jgi:hypothetical protein
MAICGRYQQQDSKQSAPFTGPKSDQKRLEIQAKEDARQKVRAALRGFLMDDCPNGCDYLSWLALPPGSKNAQAPWACICGIQWSRTTSGQSVTVQVTLQYLITYICGNH